MLSEAFAHEAETQDNSVILSTIHQSKGLEWKYVMLISVRDGDFPHYKSFDDEKQLEEERRLFYVATTRARDELAMLFPMRKNTYQYGEIASGPSMFIRELDETKYCVSRGADFIFGDEEEETIYYD